MNTKIKLTTGTSRAIQLCLAMMLLLIIAIPFSCSESFLDKQPKGVVFTESLSNKDGVNYLLIGAYAAISGAQTSTSQEVSHAASVKNWIPNCQSDDAYIGANPGGYTIMQQIERFIADPNNKIFNEKWYVCYDGISRANDVLKALAIAKDDMDESEIKLAEAQAKFIRGMWYLRLQQTYWQVPYISDETEYPEQVKNDHLVWPEIEADLQFAIDNLPGEWPNEPGKATKWAAMAYKAYTFLSQQKYSDAKPLLDAIINSGKFDLVDDYSDNFSPITENNIESIFEIQSSVNEGTGSRSRNGNADSWLCNALNRFMPTCCGFYQPSQDLVNAFKVDENGLPLLGVNGPKYNDENLENDMGLTATQEFIPTNHLLDPRLDLTVGRRGIPYLDWGIHSGSEWIRSQAEGGPYLCTKLMYYKKDIDIAAQSSYKRNHAINYRAIRFAHILLWRAECAVEENDLEKARQLVNRVRRRASDDILMGKVTTYAFPSTVQIEVDWNQPAANYKLGEYPTFPSQEYAREAVRMEERLELAMEGWRFYDLVRWGIDYEVITKYIENDQKFRYFMQGYSYTRDKNIHWPIPLVQLDLQPGVLEQDPLWK